MNLLDAAAKSFWANVNRNGPTVQHVPDLECCWLWNGALNGSGYGTFRGRGVHRWSYEYFIGMIPNGFEVCHRCDVRNCVRPSHLFAGTRSENIRDCLRKGRGNLPAKVHHGEDHGRAKLTWTKVREIRRRVQDLPKPGRDIFGRFTGPNTRGLATEYGVTSALISQVIQGKIWKDASL